MSVMCPELVKKVVAGTERLALNREIRMKKIKGAPILCELAGVSNVAELRALPESVRRALRPEMNRRLYELDRADPEVIGSLVDISYTLTSEGKEYGIRQIQPWDKEQILAIAIIVANPRTILYRRLKDVYDRNDRKRNIGCLIREQKRKLRSLFRRLENSAYLFVFYK